MDGMSKEERTQTAHAFIGAVNAELNQKCSQLKRGGERDENNISTSRTTSGH
jgi:hypothetical protein